ncbi:hypothetical protein [Desulfonatronovibrio hydrogenovorans]|uniref:hypothetical protein n=1 Tax=Desulfonatronovibrio hydrogenovorans TaxID=53245 RepID=UPI00048FAD46|nr:hypothetical protein [Desulfonatronovibrio hydrogenovorans]
MTSLTKKTRQREVQLTIPMSEIPSRKRRAGSLRRCEAVQESIYDALKQCALGRDFIAEEMSRLTGDKISVNHINNWTAESKNGWKLPLEYAAALAVITGDDRILRAALAGSGLHVINQEERDLLDLGRITADEMQRRKKKRDIIRRLDI